MKAAEIRDMTDDELFSKEEDLIRASFNLKIQQVTGQLENTSQVKATKRDLAKVKTIIKERGINK